MWARLNDFDQIFNAMNVLQRRMGQSPVTYEGSKGLRQDLNNPQNSPGTNLYDAGDNLEMQIEVAGIPKENLKIKIQGNYLELSGNKDSDSKALEGYSPHRVERRKVSFTRSFTLPSDVDSSKVEARLDNGVLTLVLPKSEAAKPKQITVQ